MKKLILLLPVIFFTFACIRVNENPSPQVKISYQTEQEGLFLHVKSGADKEHDVLMALSMANKFAEDYDVLMYFDIDGIEMVTKDAPNLEKEPFGSSDDLFDNLVNKGVTLFACPGCMKVYDMEPSDLRTGFQVADKDMFFEFTDGRILSIDY